MKTKLLKSITLLLVMLLFLTSCGTKKNDETKQPINSDIQNSTPDDTTDNVADDLEDTEFEDTYFEDSEFEDTYFEDTEIEDTTIEEEAFPIDFSYYPIVYSQNASEAATYSVQRLATRLNYKYAMLDVYDDKEGKKSEQCELLVGNTNRPESKVAYEMLTKNRKNNAADYIIMVKNENIVINAVSDYALEEAVTYFFDNICTGEYAEIAPDYKRFHKAKLIAGNGKIAGVDISEYVIVAPKDKSFIYSKEIDNLVATVCETVGVEIPVVCETEKAQKYEIVVGKTSRAISNLKLSANTYTIKEDGKKIVICGDSDISTASAVQKFAELVKKSTSNGVLNVKAGLNISGKYSASKSGYNLAWSDEFNDAKLNTANWRRHTEEANTHDGGKMYRDQSEADSYLENGNLVIKGSKDENNYRSAKVSTSGSMNFQYGYFEIRAKLPKGKGIWPAFWTNTIFTQAYSEIDVFEMFGSSNNIHSTAHRWWMMDAGAGHEQMMNYVPAQRDYTLKNGELFNDAYHTFGCEWTEDHLAFYLDGFKYTEIDIAAENMDVFHQPSYVIISMAVGLLDIDPPDENTPWPALYEIDYFRLYQKPNVGSLTLR